MSVDLFRHNEESYEKIKEQFKTNNRTCIIQPTGTGKMYLILKLIEDYISLNHDIIIIEPQKYIFKQLKEKMDKYGCCRDNVKFITYSALGKMDDEKLKGYNSPVIVMVDEMHRAGAKTWESGLRKMFDLFSDDCKYIGFSATPIRFLDGKRDMCKELFNGCVANEIGLADAILNRILPLPRYIAGLYSYSNIVSAINKKICQSCNSKEEKKELLEEVKVMKNNLDKSNGISDIFKKYIERDKGKYVAFCRNISHLKMMKPCLEKWFAEAGLKVNLYEVHSRNPEKDKQFTTFMEDDSLSVCLSIGMLSEGVHGIDGVILLRDTISPNLYYQQIGRCFSVDMKSVPIIFDLVANCEFIMDCSLKNDLLEAIDKRDKENKDSEDGNDRNKITREDIEKFFVFDQVIDAVNAFREIENKLVSSWENGLKHFDKYINEHDGDVLVPAIYKDKDDGFSLGYWVSDNRKYLKKGMLSKDRILELEKRNFIWDVNEFNFDNNLRALKQYKERTGDCLVPQNHVEILSNKAHVKLGNWVQCIRQAKKEKRLYLLLTEEKLDQLNKLKFIWDVKESLFDKFYQYVILYCKKYGHTNISQKDRIEGYNIGAAYKNLREYYKKGKLTNEQINILLNLGIDFRETKKEKQFQYKMDLARQAVEDGVIITKKNNTYNGVNFYDWNQTHKDKFTDEEKDILNHLISHKLRAIKVIDIKTNRINTYLSITEAGRALYYDFHLVNTERSGRSTIQNYLTGHTKNPIYKGRFRFEYVDEKTLKEKSPTSKKTSS